MKTQRESLIECINNLDDRTKARRYLWILISAVSMIVVGAGLMIAGLIIKPLGEIHPSVLTAAGEALTFAGSAFGIDGNYKLKHDRMMQRMYMKQWESMQKEEEEELDDMTNLSTEEQ